MAGGGALFEGPTRSGLGIASMGLGPRVEFDSTTSRFVKEIANLEATIRQAVTQVENSTDELQLEERSARVKSLMEDLASVKKDLKDHARAQPEKTDQDHILELLKRYNTDWRKHLTDAKLAWKRKTEKECERALNDMNQSQAAAFQRRKQYMNDAEKVAQSNQSLQRAAQILSSTLENGSAAYTTLKSQTSVIQKALEQQKANAALARKGKGLVTKIGRKDLHDKLMIGFAALIFCLVVVYILYKRVLRGYSPMDLVGGWS